MAGGLDGKVSLVTGAARGIGYAIAEALAAEGSAVAVTDIDAEGAEAVAAKLAEAGAHAAHFHIDVSDRRSSEAVVAEVLERWGALDILCNNAGVTHVRSVLEEDDEGFDRIIDVNVRGVVNCSRAALPTLIERAGTIVNVASVAGLIGFKRDAMYCASKGAVVMLTRQMALDYGAQGVRVNAICPGGTLTTQLEEFFAQHDDPDAQLEKLAGSQPLGRLAKPSEMGAVVAFLASDAASFVNGVALPVDGGLLAG